MHACTHALTMGVELDTAMGTKKNVATTNSIALSSSSLQDGRVELPQQRLREFHILRVLLTV